MRIFALVLFDDKERIFPIPCGNGNKNFKWLANAVASRYALAIPNGTLRRREGLCGTSENTQIQVSDIVLASGEMPHPAELLQDYLKDGDQVTVHLASKLSVEQKSGNPKSSQWFTLAHTNSQEHLQSYQLALSYEQSSVIDDYQDDELSIGESKKESNGSSLSRKGKVNFMKLVLKSQMIDPIKVEELLNQSWKTLQISLPLLKSDDLPKIKEILLDNYDLLCDLFRHYSHEEENKVIDIHHYISLIEEGDIFPAIHISSKGSLIFNHTLRLTRSSNPNYMTFDQFLVSLIFCAQLKYHDTLDPRLADKKSYLALDELMQYNIIPLGKRLDCRSLVKKYFTCDDCLVQLHSYYEVLLSAFDKAAVKLRDIPLTISLEEFSEMLYNAQLSKAPTETHFSRHYMAMVRQGTIYGRDIDVDPHDPRPFPLDEFTFPECIEALCLAGYHIHKLQSSSPTLGLEGAEDLDETDPVEWLLKGIISFSDFATGKKQKMTPLAKQNTIGNKKSTKK